MNNQIFFIFYDLAHQSECFDNLAIFLAQYLPYLVIVFAGIFLLFHHEVLTLKVRSVGEAIWNPFRILAQKWKEIILAFFSGGLAWCFAQGLKMLIHSPRPYLVLDNVVPLLNKTDFSFPSGHATFYMALAFALFFYHKKIGYLFMFFAVLIGLARIIVGVHFPIDILGGFVLGAGISYLVRFIYDKIHR